MNGSSTNLGTLKIQDKTFAKISANTVKSVQVLCRYAGRISTENDYVRYAGIKDLKPLLKEGIDGFILPVPKINSLIWDTKIARMCKMEEPDDILGELFDSDVEISSVRSWYYINLSKYILRTYILPVKRFCKREGKELIYDLGNIEMEYDLMKTGINPAMLKKAGISLLVHKVYGNAEKEIGLSDADFIMDGDCAYRDTKYNADILLIKPTRGVMERFVQGEIKNRVNRLETSALSAAMESVYYCDMLTKKGHIFDVADEMHLPKESELRKYEHILICKSCLFTEKEKKKIEKIQKYGVKINDSELIFSLMEEGEN